MTPPLTLQSDRLQESVATNESTSTQKFGLAPILWWALPAGPARAHLPMNSQEPTAGCIPDTHVLQCFGRKTRECTWGRGVSKGLAAPVWSTILLCLALGEGIQEDMEGNL
ncbi:hypothetical protein DSO57_1006948 [Entomophthora muscae]|uniref:Uncharacterized protein n=1 Tax=Entomophthora muscae TaxID=34485 RepID=A0ACC2SX03_9FUNG|nr:hypothetical protein DSO57_1006948 [Entomophthora muscae]